VVQLWRSLGFLVPAFVVACLLLVAIVIFGARRLARRNDGLIPTGGLGDLVLNAALGAWVVGLALVTLAPGRQYTVARGVELVPLRGIGNLLLHSVSWQVPFVQIGGNVALFVPGGVLLAWRAGWSAAQTVAAGVALALGIEVLQYVLGAGVASVDDLILAGVGTLLGALPVAAYRRRKAPQLLMGTEVTSTASDPR